MELGKRYPAGVLCLHVEPTQGSFQEVVRGWGPMVMSLGLLQIGQRRLLAQDDEQEDTTDGEIIHA